MGEFSARHTMKQPLALNNRRRGGATWRVTFDRSLDVLGRAAIAFLFVDAARYHISAAGWHRTLEDMHARGVPAAEPRWLWHSCLASSSDWPPWDWRYTPSVCHS
jgi:hypothetical protein